MQRIIIDTDGGVDDALALLFAAACPELRIEAITTVHGNVSLEAATRNVAEVLHIASLQITPDAGASAPLSAAPAFAQNVHGRDGLGGWKHTALHDQLPKSTGHGAHTIATLARKFPGEITLVSIGPLTNLALARREDPAGFRLLKRIVTMGGAVHERGNVTSTAEFNFYADPDAARETLHSGVPLTLVPLDATHQAVFTRARLDRHLTGASGVRADFLRCICDRLFAFYRPLLGKDLFFLHDPLAIGVALDSSLVETAAQSLDIETRGELTRGMAVPERRPWIHNPPNADVCVKVSAERFIDLFCDRVLQRARVADASA